MLKRSQVVTVKQQVEATAAKNKTLNPYANKIADREARRAALLKKRGM